MMKFIEKNLFIVLIIGIYNLFIYKYAVSVPFWDEWSLIAIQKEIYLGNKNWLTLILSNANEHLVGFGYILMTIIAFLSNFNNVINLFISSSVQVLAFLITLFVLKKETKSSEIVKGILLALLFFFVMSA